MRRIIIALSLLLSSLACAVAFKQSESNLRGSDEVNDKYSRKLANSTRADGWIAAHNSRREKYHLEFKGTYSPLAWSKELRRQAATYAKAMAANDCNIEMPSGMKYGINFNKRVGYPNIPTTNWVVNSWESKKDDGFPSNGSFTQAIWSNSTYLGCADSYNAGKKCSISICLYAKGGNCNMNKYASWEEAVMQGPGCGSCPPGVQSC